MFWNFSGEDKPHVWNFSNVGQAAAFIAEHPSSHTRPGHGMQLGQG